MSSFVTGSGVVFVDDLTGTDTPPPSGGGDTDPEPPPPEPGGCDCGITDSFDRPNQSGGWGTADFGTDWNLASGAFYPLSRQIVGGRATLTVGASYDGFSQQLINLPAWPQASRTIRGTIQWSTTNVSGVSSSGSRAILLHVEDNATGVYFEVVGRQDEGLTLNLNDVDAVTSSTGLSLSAGTDYNFLFDQNILTGHYGVKLWLASSAEPSSWTVERSATEYTDWIPGSDDLYLSAFWNGGGDLTLSFDSLDISDVDSCAGFRFDNFNRDVSSGAGTSDYGLSYTTVLSGGANEDIECFDNEDFAGAGLYVGIGAPAGVSGYVHTSAGQGGPWTNSQWTWTGRFTFLNSIVPGTATLAITNDGTIGITVGGSDFSVGTLVDDTNGSVPFAWAVSTAYLFKVNYVAGSTAEAKVWREVDPEPDWMVFGQPDQNIGPNAYLLIGNVSTIGVTGAGSSAGSLFVDWIDFDYAGRPCYEGLGETVVIDDFENRTIAVGNHPSNTGWGTASSGHAWVGDSEFGGTDTLGVTGGVGVHRYDTVSSGFGSIVNNLLGTDVPDVLLGEHSGSFRFKTNYIPSYAGSATFVEWEVDWYDDFSTILARIRMSINNTSDNTNGDAGRISIMAGTFDNTPVIPKTNWVPNLWYTARWEFDSSSFKFKLWSDSESEPGWLINEAYSGAVPSSPNGAFLELESQFQSAGGEPVGRPNPLEVLFDDVTAQPFGPVAPSEGSGGGGGGGSGGVVGGTDTPPPPTDWMTTGIAVGSFSGWTKPIPSPRGSGTTRTWTGSTSLETFLSSLNPGDVGVLDYTGTRTEDVTLSFPSATLDTRIYVVNAPGKRPVGAGLLHITGGSYWSIFGLNWTTSGSVGVDDHMVKLDNGNHWEFGCAEIWGGSCFTEMRPGQTAVNWRIAYCYIHDNPGPHGTNNQDHLIYADPSSANSQGLIERCLLVNSPHGRGVKIGGPSSGGPAIGGITVSHCTAYNNLGPSNIQVSNGAQDNVVEYCILQKSGASANVTTGGGLVSGAGNVVKNTIGWEASQVGEFDGSTLLDGGGNQHVDPQLNLTTFVASASAAAGRGHLS